MAVTYSATGTSDARTASLSSGDFTRTSTITIPTGGADRAVLGFALSACVGGITDASATCGGTAMTKLASVLITNVNTDCYVYIFGLLNPPSGSQSVAVTTNVTATGSNRRTGIAQSVCYTGVLRFGGTNSATGTGATRTVSISGAERGDMVANMFGANDTTSVPTSYSQTQRVADQVYVWSQVCGDAYGNYGGSVSFSSTNGSELWGGLAVIMKQVPDMKFLSVF